MKEYKINSERTNTHALKLSPKLTENHSKELPHPTVKKEKKKHLEHLKLTSTDSFKKLKQDDMGLCYLVGPSLLKTV